MAEVAPKTSLGIWALGPMVTRFVPGGYQPERAGESTAGRVKRAVDGLGELIDDYEFHYPQELSEENLDDVREALGGHGIYTVCTGTHLNPRFGKGGLSSPDDAVRADALAEALAAARFAGEIGAQMVLWPGVEGYNYPFQTPYRDAWARFIDGVGQVASQCAESGTLLFLEHKNSEPAMKIFMRNIGMTLHVIHTLRAQGITNVKVNMDWQHLLMNGESLAEYAALLDAEDLLGHQHANSGLGDVRRRQHGRRHSLHGDPGVGPGATPGEVRRERRAARLRPLPVHRRRRGGSRPGRSTSGTSSGSSRAASTGLPWWKPNPARTRCAPTSSSTPHSVRRHVRLRRARRGHHRREGGRNLARRLGGRAG